MNFSRLGGLSPELLQALLQGAQQRMGQVPGQMGQLGQDLGNGMRNLPQDLKQLPNESALPFLALALGLGGLGATAMAGSNQAPQEEVGEAAPDDEDQEQPIPGFQSMGLSPQDSRALQQMLLQQQQQSQGMYRR